MVSKLFCCFLALLVCNAARSFASRLARSLAFAAAAVLFAFVEIARFQSCNSFHDNDSLQLIYSIIETKMFFVKSYPTLIRRRNTSRNGGEQRERRTRRTQAPLLQPQLVAVVCFGSLCSASHTTKTALSSLQLLHPVRLFSPCVSLVCAVRDCVAFCYERHAGEVARLSADLYCREPVCRSLLATN